MKHWNFSWDYLCWGVFNYSSRIRDGCPSANRSEFEWDHWPSLFLVEEYRKTAFNQSLSSGSCQSLSPALADIDSLHCRRFRSKYEFVCGSYDICVLKCLQWARFQKLNFFKYSVMRWCCAMSQLSKKESRLLKCSSNNILRQKHDTKHKDN